jgi:patatin-like phospholipase/acyl hydrolase
MATTSKIRVEEDKIQLISDAADGKKKIKVLAIDGGGVRGIIPAVIIKAIEDKAGKPISELFDYIAGTSIGGVLGACYVVSKKDGSHLYTSDYIINHWENMLNEVFPQDYWSWVKNSFGVFDSKYDRTGIESLVNKIFGENKLTDTMIPISLNALRLEDNMPKAFSTLHACSDQKENFYLREAVAATAAAPPFLTLK